MKIERDKWYVMRNGEKVRVVCVDAPGTYPVLAVDDEGRTYSYRSGGTFFSHVGDHRDLISEHREPARVFVNMYADGSLGGAHRYREEAEDAAIGGNATRIAVEFVEVVNGRDDG